MPRSRRLTRAELEAKQAALQKLYDEKVSQLPFGPVKLEEADSDDLYEAIVFMLVACENLLGPTPGSIVRSVNPPDHTPPRPVS